MKSLIGKKAGMTHIFDESGDEIPVTVLEMGPCPVTQIKSVEKDGYEAIQLAFEPFQKKDQRKFKKPQIGHFNKANIKPYCHLREFRVEDGPEKLSVGDVLTVEIFNDVEFVSVTATSKGRGFAGVVKRHGFSGANMTHGAHEQFRHPGSIGMCNFPGRVLPGKKLPGQYGSKKVKTLNLEVVKIFLERNILLVKGATPGPNGSIVTVEQSSRKKKRGKLEPITKKT
ncbi:MAG TPA: 50S ribosomal protein L3 [Nitrospinota bacterium]|nr:50S ribosomal protein L3 [Nitrospinota bacterium]